MNNVKKIAIGVIVASIIVGSIFGLLVQSSNTKLRSIAFKAAGNYSQNRRTCGGIPGNYSDWFQLFVLGNRTGLSLTTVSILDTSTQIQITLPLNSSQSAFVSYYPFNTTVEVLSVPLPSYWNRGATLTATLSYSFTGFTLQTYNLGEFVLSEKNMTC